MISESLKSSAVVNPKVCLMCDSYQNLCQIHQNDDRKNKKIVNQTDLNEESKEKIKKQMKACESEIINQSSKYVSEITEAHTKTIKKMKKYNRSLKGSDEFENYYLDVREIPFIKEAIKSSTSFIQKPLIDEINNLKSQVQKKNKSIENLNKQITNFNSTVNKLEQENKDLKKRYDGYKKHKCKLKEMVRVKQAQKKEINKFGDQIVTKLVKYISKSRSTDPGLVPTSRGDDQESQVKIPDLKQKKFKIRSKKKINIKNPILPALKLSSRINPPTGQ